MVSSAEFYAALRRIAEIKVERGLDWLEIGNLEAYERALSGKPDRVCTMFGSTCGSGFHNIIYMQREVTCGAKCTLADACSGRSLVLGRFDEPLDVFPQRMAAWTSWRSPVVGRVPSVALRGTSTLIATIPRRSDGQVTRPCSWFTIELQ
jgi:hypothetical protein